jgi:hypothetical protein
MLFPLTSRADQRARLPCKCLLVGTDPVDVVFEITLLSIQTRLPPFTTSAPPFRHSLMSNVCYFYWSTNLAYIWLYLAKI